MKKFVLILALAAVAVLNFSIISASASDRVAVICSEDDPNSPAEDFE